MNKVTVLAFIIALMMLAKELYQFAVLSALGDQFYGIGFLMWFGLMQAKILFLYLLAARLDQFIWFVKGILFQAAYRNYTARMKRERRE